MAEVTGNTAVQAPMGAIRSPLHFGSSETANHLPHAMQGQLFTQDFLRRGVLETPPWQALNEAVFNDFRQSLTTIFPELHGASTINEAQTEALVINKVLVELGWSDDTLPQVNLSGKRREDVPDVLLFANSTAKAAALAETRDDRRYRHGLAILEAKRWMRPLDRGDHSEATDPDAPSSQMLRYLSRADIVSDRKIKWGMLSNGAVWRLYWQDARSRAEEFSRSIWPPLSTCPASSMNWTKSSQRMP